MFEEDGESEIEVVVVEKVENSLFGAEKEVTDKDSDNKEAYLYVNL